MSEITTKQRLAAVQRIKVMTFSNLRKMYEVKQLNKEDYRITHTSILELEELLKRMDDRDLTWEQLLQFIALDDKKYYEDLFSQP